MSFDIRLLLRNVLLASLGTGGFACGGSATADEPLEDEPITPVTPNDFAALACHPMSGVDKVAPVQASGGFDYVELHEEPAVGVGNGHQLLQSAGVQCATATDPTACEQAIADAATSYAGFTIGYCVGGGPWCSSFHYVVNQGDAVHVISHADDLLALLGSIDTPSEATLRVLLDYYDVACEDLENGAVRAVDGGFEVIATSGGEGCSELDSTRYLLAVTTAGAVTELESEEFSSGTEGCVGRRPSCMDDRRASGRSRLGAYFGSMAHLEEAAVHAFVELRRELVHHGAPTTLVQAIERALRDEVRHTGIMRRMARRFGGHAPRPRVTHRAPRSLELIARDNAAEGCVRETFGALVGMWQASHARDRQIRYVMHAIARDETNHAALSWEIDRWARSRLTPPALARVDRARDEALRQLRSDAAAEQPSDPSLVEWAGVPSHRDHRALVDRFVDAIATSHSS